MQKINVVNCFYRNSPALLLRCASNRVNFVIMGPIEKLLMFSFAMLTLPIGGFLGSKAFLFEGEQSDMSSLSFECLFFQDCWAGRMARWVGLYWL